MPGSTARRSFASKTWPNRDFSMPALTEFATRMRNWSGTSPRPYCRYFARRLRRILRSPRTSPMASRSASHVRMLLSSMLPSSDASSPASKSLRPPSRRMPGSPCSGKAEGAGMYGSSRRSGSRTPPRAGPFPCSEARREGLSPHTPGRAGTPACRH